MKIKNTATQLSPTKMRKGVDGNFELLYVADGGVN